MPYAWVLASCSMGSPMFRLFLDLAFPSALLLWIHWITSEGCLCHSLCLCVLSDSLKPVGFPLYLGCPPLNSGIACLAYLNPGIACLASQSSDWLDAFWASLSGVKSSVTLVKLNVIGHS